MNFNNQDRQ